MCVTAACKIPSHTQSSVPAASTRRPGAYHVHTTTHTLVIPIRTSRTMGRTMVYTNPTSVCCIWSSVDRATITSARDIWFLQSIREVHIENVLYVISMHPVNEWMWSSYIGAPLWTRIENMLKTLAFVDVCDCISYVTGCIMNQIVYGKAPE